MYQSLTSTKASPPANSKAIGAIFELRVPKKKQKQKQKRLLFLEGERGQQYFSFLTTTRFYDVKQKRNYSVMTSRSIAATS